MAHRKPRQWFCDECGKLIERPEHGCLEWYLDSNDQTCGGFEIVHQKDHSPNGKGGCGGYHEGGSEPLRNLVGDNAIPGMLKFIDQAAEEPVFRGPRTHAFREWAEVFRRLTIPYYEEARYCIDRATKAGSFGWQGRTSALPPESLERLAEKFGK